MNSSPVKTHKKLIVLEIIAFAGLILIIFLLCGSNTRADVPLYEIHTSVLEQIGDLSVLKQSDAMGLKKYYGLDAKEYTDFCLYLPASNMDASELLIIILKDETQAEEVKKACEERLAQEKNVFESYGVEQMELINNARLESYGPYLAFLICSDSDKCADAFKKTVVKSLF